MSEPTADRTYWHVPGARSWHASSKAPRDGYAMAAMTVDCGRRLEDWKTLRLEHADRVPSDGHLCGSCSRVIAARTDVEG